MVSVGMPRLSVIGREEELARVAAFLAAEDGAALVVNGEPGIGKTTLWEAGLEAARGDGWRVLAARGAESEAQLSFVGLNDLLREVDVAAIAALPAPQRRALEVVLLRAEPDGAGVQPAAAAVALANVLQALGAERSVLVAIDDVVWLDRASQEALAFAARRLRDGRVRFFLARRAGEQSSLERAFGSRPLVQVEVGPLSLGATRVLLAERLRRELPRRLLRRVFDLAEGNPLLALDLARPLGPGAGEVDVASAAIASAEPFDREVAALSPRLRRGLLALALAADLNRAELESVCGRDVVEAAVSAGLLVDGRDRLRLVHPLLAAAVRRRSTAGERRALHLEIARSVAGEVRALSHEALGTLDPAPELARRAAAAAAGAAAQGRVYTAVELGQHALRLTEPGDPHQLERLLELAYYLVVVGELAAVTKLLVGRLEQLPGGRMRARAHLLLGEAAALPEHEWHLEQALEQSAGEPDLRAAAFAARAILLALIRVADVARAEALAEQALATAAAAGAEVRQRALLAVAWTRALRGRPVEERDAAAVDGAPRGSIYESAVARPAAVRLIWRGEIVEARSRLRRLLALAEQRGEARSCVVLQLHLCELELRIGDARAASAILDEWVAWTGGERVATIDTVRARCQALLAAIRGDRAEVAAWAGGAVAGSERSGSAWDRLEALRARGLAALAEHAPDQAAEALRAVWRHTCSAGIDDPGAFPVGADLVEALYALGETDEARAVTARLARAAREQEHPWARASLMRCEAAACAAAGGEPEALNLFEAAAAAYGELDLRFDQARALLEAGRVARRMRRWGVARRLLRRAADAFTELGATGWADEAAGELDRVGARRPAVPGDLTAAERRVAALAAAGLSNKEIARRLVISVSTVETHLKRCYGKLGVSSRTQLAAGISAAERPAR